MASAMQDKGHGSVSVAGSREVERYDPLRIALGNARAAFDPQHAAQERRAATAPLIWYIEDMPDLPRPRADRETRTL